MALTRRGFLTRIAAAGGASLAYESMLGLGLLAAPAQAPFNLTGQVKGVRVVILGGGLSGLATAYELGKAGFDCRILEARPRPGGRCFTVRRSTVSEEEGSTQTAAFNDGNYFNAGPMRISHHHHTTLAYCRELNVATEVFVPDCESAYLAQTRGALAGKRVRLREARADFDGYIAELLSKSLSQVALDRPMTTEDRDRVLAYLRSLGALDERGAYRGSSRRGDGAPPPLGDLFAGIPGFYVQTDWSSQPTMMQVAGGMDRLPAAFAARVGANRITYRAVVSEIRQSERGVSIGYSDATGRPQRTEADYCVTTIPLPVLAGITKDLSQPHPQYAAEFEHAFSVTWARVPWSRGSWRSESDAALEQLKALQQPDGRVHFAGDYMTDMSSWMQGALESARTVSTAIHQRALARR